MKPPKKISPASHVPSQILPKKMDLHIFSPSHSNMRIQRYSIATKSIYLQNPGIRVFQIFYHPSPPFPVLSLAITQPNPPPHFQILHFFFGAGPVGVIDPSVSSSSSSS